MSEDSSNITYRDAFSREPGDSRAGLGEPLITVSPKNLDARTRHQSTMAMATLATIGAWTSRERIWKHPSGAKFDTTTASGIIGCFMFNYEALAPSLDGKSRDEYVKVASFIAVGQTENDSLTQNLLNEGSKNLSGKAAKTK